MPNPEVLVVGAGPTGLIVANELLRRGIATRIVDKRPTPSGATKAFTVHARTLEMFLHMGLAHRIEEMRETCPGNQFHFDGVDLPAEKMPILDFRRLPGTRYNYYGKVIQRDLERALKTHILAQHSVQPEWGVELKSLAHAKDGVRAILVHRGAGDREEIVEVPWLIGADGMHSTVRSELGIHFDTSQTYSNMTMSMCDAVVDGLNFDPAWVNYFVAQDGFLLVTKLPDDLYRMYVTGRFEKKLDPEAPQAAYQYALEHFKTGGRIERLMWSSTWVIHKVVADRYVDGRVILCGDATHVHSPAGGQGMNACMQDAFNLGWKLAATIRGRAATGLLDSYAAERRPIAQQVTDGANRMHQVLFNAEVPIKERYTLTQNQGWHDEAVLRISGLSHNYRAVWESREVCRYEGATVAPGDRIPDVTLSEIAPRTRLHDLLRSPDFSAVIVPRADDGAGVEANALAQRIERDYGRWVRPVVLAPAYSGKIRSDFLFVDHSNQLCGQLGIDPREGAVVLIRPDLCVASLAPFARSEECVADLRHWFDSGSASRVRRPETAAAVG